MSRPRGTERPSEAERFARTAHCPTCMADPHKPCQTRYGRTLSYSHSTRVEAAEANKE